ncbi:MAG TPA: hypothetical protein VF183_10375 [Acidimicrobiales bacterium]
MRRVISVFVMAVVLVMAWQSPVAAHGQGHGALPVEQWQVVYASVAAIVIAALLLRPAPPRDRLVHAGHGRPLPPWCDRAAGVAGTVLRAVGLLAWVVALTAAWLGTDNAADNLVPGLVYVVFWVGLPLLSALAGDVWRALSPFTTLAAALPERRSRSSDALLRSDWPAAVVALAFTWLELCYHSPTEPRVLAVAIGACSVVVLAAAARLGKGWLRDAEPFAVIVGLFAAMAPMSRDGEGRLRARLPLSGLAQLTVRRGTVALVCVLLASAGFDGVRATSWWLDVVDDRAGWGRTLVDTAGLLGVVAVVAVAWWATCAVTARALRQPAARVASWLTPALVPVALGHAPVATDVDVVPAKTLAPLVVAIGASAATGLGLLL